MASGATKPRRQSPPRPPRTLDVRKYAESRAAELTSLHSLISTRLNDDFRSQRNKRRRTTGFDSKRRRKHLRTTPNSGDDDNEKKEKLPRRVRRRIELTKRNDELGFSVSGDGTKRLRTHVWHAKRFTMVKNWGFYLPLGLHGSGRGSRALLKWYKQGAVVHDVSYYSAVELRGPEDALSSILNMLLVPSSMDRSEDICKLLLSGDIYGHAMLHHSREDCYKAICPVTFMWRPQHQNKNDDPNDGDTDESVEIESSSSLRQLWIWLHPSAFNEGLDCLQLTCQKMTNETGVVVGCVPLDGQLAKLEVLGSQAFQLLQKILRPITFSVENSLQLKPCSTLGETGACKIKHNNILEKEECFHSAAVVCLTVLDPRSSCHKRSVAVPDAHIINNLGDPLEGKSKENTPWNTLIEKEVPSILQSKYDSISSLYNYKDLWDASTGVHPPMEEHFLCSERHQKSLDFFHIKNKYSTKSPSAKSQSSSLCPIMLLRRVYEAGLHDGWSIILPICWVNAFWIPLVSGGAHAIGLREKHWIACDIGLPYFPSDFPDCSANCNVMEKESSAVDNKIDNCSVLTKPFQIPIQLPWNSNWFVSYRSVGEASRTDFSSNLVDPGKLSNKPLEVSVARTTRMLTSFLKEVCGDNTLLFPKVIGGQKFSHLMMKEADISQTSNLDAGTCDRKNLCYLRVVLHAFKEGVFEEGAVVYAPTYSDITSRIENNECLKVPHAYVDSYFQEQTSGKWEFQLPEDAAAREAFRSPIGFVTTGFVRGSKRPAAVAYCEALLLAQLRSEQWSRVAAKKRRKKIFVLVRNLRSTAYRLALASIVLEKQDEDVESL